MASDGESSGYGLLTVRENLWMFSQFYAIPVSFWLTLIRRALMPENANLFPIFTELSNNQLLLILVGTVVVFSIVALLSFRYFDHLARERGNIDMVSNLLRTILMSYIMQGELNHTPIGPIYFRASQVGLKRISLFPLGVLEPPTMIDSTYQAFKVLSAAMEQMNEYLICKRTEFDLPLDFEDLTPFQKKVLCASQEIPYGEVRTYTQLAAQIGKPMAARAVGSALAANPLLLVIPCHRVIGAHGNLGGFAAPGSIAIKQKLLRLEGVKFNQGQVML